MINKLYNLDCFEFLDMVDDKSIDLGVIDPPYNLNVDTWDRFNTLEAFLQFTYTWINKLIPKLKDSSSLYVFNTPFNSAFICKYLHEKNLDFQNWIIWDKRDGLSSAKRKFVNSQEAILFFTKGNDYEFNFDDVRVPYESESRIAHASKKGILKNGKRWFPNPNGKLCGEIWHFTSERHNQKVNGRTRKMVHPTIKPYGLIERIVKASSKEGDLVLDCFTGTGTVPLVCKNLNRNFVACDNKQKNIMIAQKRLETGKLDIDED